MGHCFVTGPVPRLLFFWLLLLMAPCSLSFDRVAALSTNDLVGERCEYTRNAKSCLEIIKLVPGAAGAKDLLTLASVTVPYTYSRGMSTFLYIKEVVRREEVPGLTGAYNACFDAYGNATSLIKNSDASLRNHDYSRLHSQLDSAHTWFSKCAEALSKSPSLDPFHLALTNSDFLTLTDFLIAVANGLEKKKQH